MGPVTKASAYTKHLIPFSTHLTSVLQEQSSFKCSVYGNSSGSSCSKGLLSTPLPLDGAYKTRVCKYRHSAWFSCSTGSQILKTQILGLCCISALESIVLFKAHSRSWDSCFSTESWALPGFQRLLAGNSNSDSETAARRRYKSVVDQSVRKFKTEREWSAVTMRSRRGDEREDLTLVSLVLAARQSHWQGCSSSSTSSRQKGE